MNSFLDNISKFRFFTIFSNWDLFYDYLGRLKIFAEIVSPRESLYYSKMVDRLCNSVLERLHSDRNAGIFRTSTGTKNN